jgi:hypothetical protein
MVHIMPPKQSTSLIQHLRNLASHAHKQAKEAKIISKTLNAAGFKTAGSLAAMAGYGRKKRVVRTRRRPLRR